MLPRRDTRLRARTGLGGAVPRAASALGAGRHADAAEDESSLLRGALVAATALVFQLRHRVHRWHSAAHLLPGARLLLSVRRPPRARAESRAAAPARAVSAPDDHELRATLTWNGIHPDLGALQHDALLDVHQGDVRLFRAEAAAVQRHPERYRRRAVRHVRATARHRCPVGGGPRVGPRPTPSRLG